MSDLEEDLLALAGGAGSDFEDDDDFETTNNNKRSSTAESSSQRKKKKVVQDEDEDDAYDFGDEDDQEEDDYDPEGAAAYDDDEDEDEESNPYPLEGKYKNERDRLELSEMADIERESILFERSQELERFNERRLLKQRAKQNQFYKDQQQERTSTRTKKVKENAKSIKSSKLSELKRQREKKSRKDRDYDEDDYEDEVEDDYDLGYGDEDDDDGYEPDFTGSTKDDVEWAESTKRREVTLLDINNVRIGHSMAEKYCFYPNFNDIMVGTYGRIRVSQNSHRMVKIEAVVKGRPYKLRSGLTTDQYFSLSQPGKDKKNFQMTYLSDERIHTDEFEKYKSYIEEAQNQGKHVYAPSVAELEDKFRALKAFSSQGLTGETFNAFLRNKSRFNDTNKTGTFILDKKLEIQQRLQEARESNDQAKIHDYNKQLDEIEKSFQKVNVSKVSMDSIAAKISEKNRRLNNTTIRQAEIRNNERKKTSIVSNANPFARLTTRARMYYQDTKKNEDEKAKLEAVKVQQEKQEREQILLETKSCTFKKLGQMDGFIKSIDFKFDI